WSRPYVRAGYSVINVTLPEYDVCLYRPPKKVYGILAAPPCTEFSLMKQLCKDGNYTYNFKAGLEIVSACMRIILLTQPKWWVIENPKGHLSKWLGSPTFVFEPWYYGDNYKKSTYLWGSFNLPQRTVFFKPLFLKSFVEARRTIYLKKYSNLTQQERSSITPPGFAKAFFEANK
ncbi:unnamed protein product, partial [marine sediment metagenome]